MHKFNVGDYVLYNGHVCCVLGTYTRPEAPAGIPTQLHLHYFSSRGQDTSMWRYASDVKPLIPRGDLEHLALQVHQTSSQVPHA